MTNFMQTLATDRSLKIIAALLAVLMLLPVGHLFPADSALHISAYTLTLRFGCRGTLLVR